MFGPFLLRGVGKYQLRDLFITFFFLLLICVEWGYIIKAGLRPSLGSSPKMPPYKECVASGKGGKIPGTRRDCMTNQGPDCTFQQPCTPCTNALLNLKPIAGGSPCVSCSLSNTGTCGFLQGIGPYCEFGINGKSDIRPCERCCML
jgi:hypothetical protein